MYCNQAVGHDGCLRRTEGRRGHTEQKLLVKDGRVQAYSNKYRRTRTSTGVLAQADALAQSGRHLV